MSIFCLYKSLKRALTDTFPEMEFKFKGKWRLPLSHFLSAYSSRITEARLVSSFLKLASLSAIGNQGMHPVFRKQALVSEEEKDTNKLLLYFPRLGGREGKEGEGERSGG